MEQVVNSTVVQNYRAFSRFRIVGTGLDRYRFVPVGSLYWRVCLSCMWWDGFRAGGSQGACLPALVTARAKSWHKVSLRCDRLWRSSVNRASEYERYCLPSITLHARFWTLSILSDSLLVSPAFQQGVAYSSVGLIYPQYTVIRSGRGTPARRSLFRKNKRLLPLVTMASTWSDQRRSDRMCRPSNFACLTILSVWPPRVSGGISGGVRMKQKYIALHFLGLSDIEFVSDQVSRLLRSDCKFVGADTGLTSPKFKSSCDCNSAPGIVLLVWLQFSNRDCTVSETAIQQQGRYC